METTAERDANVYHHPTFGHPEGEAAGRGEVWRNAGWKALIVLVVVGCSLLAYQGCDDLPDEPHALVSCSQTVRDCAVR